MKRSITHRQVPAGLILWEELGGRTMTPRLITYTALAFMIVPTIRANGQSLSRPETVVIKNGFDQAARATLATAGTWTVSRSPAESWKRTDG